MRIAIALAIAGFLLSAVSLRAQMRSEENLRLRRPDDASLKKLQAEKLKSLNIQDGRDVTDAGLEAIAKLDQLETLYLHRSAGTDAGLAHLSGLENLRSLNIRMSPQYTEAGLKHFENLRHLSRLEYSGEITGEGLKHLRNLRKLRHLQFAAGRLSAKSLGVLTKLPRLNSLSLIGGTVDKAAMSQIAAIGNLQYLEFSKTKFPGDALLLIGRCQKLKTLSFRSIPVKDPVLDEIAKIDTLKFLTLFQTEVTATGVETLSSLPNLTFLNLSFSKEIHDEIRAPLGNFQKLKNVTLHGTSVTQEGGRAIRDFLPEVNVSHLASRKK